MRLADRSSSSAPVTTRLTERMSRHRAAKASSNQASGVSGKSCRCTEPCADGCRDSQASSAVKDRIGASQTTTRVKTASITVSAARRATLERGSQ